MKLQRHVVKIGALEVQIELDEQGMMTALILPKQPPKNLDAPQLNQLLQKLEKYPLRQDGPPFFRKAWALMRAIPWGKAITYRELATAAGKPQASRAAGQACARNPLPLIVPCHRVLAQEGLGGYAFGLEWKSKLLEIESEPQPQPR